MVEILAFICLERNQNTEFETQWETVLPFLKNLFLFQQESFSFHNLPLPVQEWKKIVQLFSSQLPIFQKQFLQLLLNKITDVIGKRYLMDISSQEQSRILEMVASGTKASVVHVMQMIAILGLTLVQGKTIPMNYARERALPHFASEDCHPSSLGYLNNGYESGLRPAEMYFNALQGREALVHVVADTPQLGYASRRFLRNFEDISIAYDLTVRDPTGVVSFLDGDDGFSPNFVEKQKYFILTWTRRKIETQFSAQFQFCSEWLDTLHLDLQKECMQRRQELNYLLNLEIQQIIKDVISIRKMKTFFHPSASLDQNIVTAIDFDRTLRIHRSQMFERRQEKNRKE